MPVAIIAFVKLAFVIGSSVFEFLRALMDIREMVKKFMAESRDHCRKAYSRSKKHFHNKRGHHD